jgi:hypothetical protein
VSSLVRLSNQFCLLIYLEKNKRKMCEMIQLQNAPKTFGAVVAAGRFANCRRAVLFLILAAFMAATAPVFAQISTFTYQGRLTDGAASGGNQSGQQMADFNINETGLAGIVNAAPNFLVKRLIAAL